MSSEGGIGENLHSKYSTLISYKPLIICEASEEDKT